MKTREEIIAEHPLIEHMQERGCKLRRSGHNFISNRCAKIEHAEDHFPVAIETSKQVWYCNDCKIGGSVLDFMAFEQNIPVPEVLKQLSGNGNSNGSDKIVEVAKYDYTDENNNLLYQVVRFVPKTFRQRHKVDGKWVWSMDGVRRVLYRLPEVIKSDSLFVCEGEKDCDSLVKLGLPATCNVGGAGKWLDSYSDCLKGKHVIIWADNDDAGLKHAAIVQKSIAGKAKLIFRWPGKDKDASDFVKRVGEEVAKKEISDTLATLQPVNPVPDLPVKSMDELEQEYIEFQKRSAEASVDLGRWLPSLRTLTRPLVPGELAVILADTGVGKTALLQNIALAICPVKILFFELELPGSLLFERFIQVQREMRGREVWSQYREGNPVPWRSQNRLSHVFTCTQSRLDPSEMEKFINLSELKIGERPALVIVDYVGLMSGVGHSRYERISNVAENLKIVAKATNVVMLIASQIHRPETGRKSAEIFLHDAKDSGSIENSAGLVLGAWRDEDGRKLNLKILKNTKGRSGRIIECNFDGETLGVTERAQESIIPVNKQPYPD